MRFIEKYPQSAKSLILNLEEERENPPEDEHFAMNFELFTQKYESAGYGRCSIYNENDIDDYLHITGIYVSGNTNYPTLKSPNQFVGVGQLLVFTAIKFGLEHKSRIAKLTALDGSEGFYLKMGLHPDVMGNPNRMASKSVSQGPGGNNGKLDPDWLKKFEQSSFLNRDFRGPCWVGGISDIYLRLRGNILRNWEIIE